MMELIGIEGKATRPPPCKLLDWFSHPSLKSYLINAEKPNACSVTACSEEEFLVDKRNGPHLLLA